LRRLNKLTDINLRFNPVALGKSIGSSHAQDAPLSLKIQEYYERVRECLPHIEELDDEPVDDGFFDLKIK
jgi:hypothetical protein